VAEHDESYRLLFSSPRMVEDLLRGFVAEPWVDELDFATLAPVETRLVSGRLRRREADLLWRVAWRGEPRRWLYVYLLLEFQSTVDRWMAVRMLGYVALLYQDLIRRGELTEAGELPPVVPVVLYNGRRAWEAAREVADLIAAGPAELAAHRPRLGYLLLDEGRLPAGALAAGGNLAAALFRLEWAPGLEQMREEMVALAARLAGPGDGELRRAFAAWLGQVLLPARLAGAGVPERWEPPEDPTMLQETVNKWVQELLEEGRQEGRREGEAAVLLRLLERRFPCLPKEVHERIEAAGTDQLLRWAERVLAARSLDEVFAG
jgi:hypothetical protein